MDCKGVVPPYLDKVGKLVWSLLPLQQCCTPMNTFVEQCVCVGGLCNAIYGHD